jgi:DNA-binding XRE family transcriptional regulator
MKPKKISNKLNDLFISEKEHLKNIKCKRPDLFKLLDNPTPKARLAANIYLLRASLRLTQKEISDKAHVGLKTFQHIEEAQPVSNPTMEVIEAIAKALKVDIQQLYQTVEAN